MDRYTPEQIVSDYFSHRDVLIALPNGAARVGVARALLSLGSATNRLTLVSDLDSATADLFTRKPPVIVTDMTVNNRSGLELCEKKRSIGVAPRDSLFFIITADRSQSAIAVAAEEDVDAYLLNPYTLSKLRSVLTEVTLAKVFPSEYMRCIEAGKELMFRGDFLEAIKHFDQALNHDIKPSLALFYRGQAEQMQSLLDKAGGSYEAGLKFNEIHYKCLVGLFDLLLKKGKKHDAYEIVKKISRYFPASPQRLIQILRLAVETGHFEDIESFYAAYKEIDDRDDGLQRHMIAALLVTARHLIDRKEVARADELLRDALASARDRASALREIVLLSCLAGTTQTAEKALSRFTPLDRSGIDYHVARISLDEHFGNSAALRLHEIQSLALLNLVDEQLNQIAIRALEMLGRHDEIPHWQSQGNTQKGNA